MKIRRIDRRLERDILIGMIIDRHYMAQISSHVQLKFFKNAYARTVASWCLDYFEKYNDVPFKKISDIYDYQSGRGSVEENEVDMIEKLLETINEDYTEKDIFNTDFLLDVTQEYFNRVRLEDGIKRVEGELEEFGPEKAQETLTRLITPVNLNASRAIDPFCVRDKIEAAFDDDAKPLLKVPGDLGHLLNEQLTRASMVSFQAPEKSGKSWMLSYMKRVALEQGLKVLEFQLGDLTEKQVIVRDSISIAGKSNKAQYCGTFKKPVRFVQCSDEDNKECLSAPIGWDVEYEEVTIETPLTAIEALKKNKRYYKKHCIVQDKSYRLIVAPARVLNMRTIDDHCERLYLEEGFVPDVIVCDYMDILAKENYKDDGRDAINENWIQAKAIVNKRSCLLLTATQSNTESYNGDIQGRANFSNDKRKFGHVNGMYGLNQTSIEKKHGIQKINTVIARDGEFSSGNVCYVIQCLRQGQPVVDSLMPHLHWDKKQERQAEEIREKVIDNIAPIVRTRRKGNKRR